jgi:hypothetical protein
VRVSYSSPVPASGRLAPVVVASHEGEDPALRDVVDAVNSHVDLLNSRLFGYQDYAVIGAR